MSNQPVDRIFAIFFVAFWEGYPPLFTGLLDDGSKPREGDLIARLDSFLGIIWKGNSRCAR
jgi:hypothetical protein